MHQNDISIEFDTHWGEMDALGHINHTRYLVWCETARLSLFERVGLICRNDSIAGPILATASARYLSPVSHPARIVIKAWVSAIGNTSFVVDYQILQKSETQNVVATCQTVVVVYDYTRGVKRPLSDSLREKLQALMP